jgi:hypothetical protein
VDPADKPGANNPKSRDPTEPINEVEVAKTLEKLESIASTLVREVGAADGATQTRPAAPAGAAPPPAPPVTLSPPAPSAAA